MFYTLVSGIDRPCGFKETGIRCGLCPHECFIAEGGSGRCGVRTHRKGILEADSYGQISSLAYDPIEKKPLKRFHPGSTVLSIGTFGCNLRCDFCQNWKIARQHPPVVYIPPKQLVEMVPGDPRCIGIAYTYNEPVTFYEYMLDAGRLARERGYCNVMVTNGTIQKEPLLQLGSILDAVNVDVKAFTEDFYRAHCAGSLEWVKQSVEILASICHVEITTLIIPGLNDSPEEIRQLAAWLAGIRRDIPLHLSRYFPAYRRNTPATPPGTLKTLAATASEYLDHVFLGNL
ncbi:MAG TPA: AmmeMemoRadiSam system radical SAM enzyme [Clostridiales bacterium]|nr:AmmeMemoRadiSam system radical SAM enzyme [Clostridiales bacterium]